MTKREMEKRILALEQEVKELKAKPAFETHNHYHYEERKQAQPIYPWYPPYNPYAPWVSNSTTASLSLNTASKSGAIL